MKFCNACGDEIETRDGDNRCARCERTDGNRKKRRQARREREAALRSCGLVKVRGALGGTYWE